MTWHHRGKSSKLKLTLPRQKNVLLTQLQLRIQHCAHKPSGIWSFCTEQQHNIPNVPIYQGQSLFFVVSLQTLLKFLKFELLELSFYSLNSLLRVSRSRSLSRKSMNVAYKYIRMTLRHHVLHSFLVRLVLSFC